MRRAGNAKPEATSARAHPLAGLGHRLVGQPTALNAGSPGATWT